MATFVTKERDPGSATVRDTKGERGILKTWLLNGRRASALPGLNQESIT